MRVGSGVPKTSVLAQTVSAREIDIRGASLRAKTGFCGEDH